MSMHALAAILAKSVIHAMKREQSPLSYTILIIIIIIIIIVFIKKNTQIHPSEFTIER
jgi:uncharacterized integral membrane protein